MKKNTTLLLLALLAVSFSGCEKVSTQIQLENQPEIKPVNEEVTVQIKEDKSKQTKENCEDSGGTFKNDKCECPSEFGQDMYNRLNGYCETTYGGPGGKLGDEMAKEVGKKLEATSYTLAYIQNIEEKDGKTYITIDEVKWLTELDGTCGSTAGNLPQCNPNGFLIENSDKSTRNIEIDLPGENFEVNTTNLGADPLIGHTIYLPEFKKMLESNKEYFQVAPFDVGILYGKVISISERYIP